MRLVPDGGSWRIEGPGSDARARRVRAPRGRCASSTRSVHRSTGMISVLDPLSDSRWDESSTSPPRVGVPLAGMARGAEAHVRLRAPRPDDDREGAAGERPRVVPRQHLGLAAPGLTPLLGSLRPASRPARRTVRDARVSGGGDGKGRWRSLELRPRHVELTGLAKGASYYLHTLDLARPADQIFDGFHHSSTQRAIRRAEREGLSYEAGRPSRCCRPSAGCSG